MASYVPAKKNTEFIFYIGLVDQSNPLKLKSAPTIASGDFKVSIDGGALANLTTLPAVTPGSSVMVKVTLSTSEMNGDNITFVAIDAAGDEWCDLVVNIQTAAAQIDDIYTRIGAAGAGLTAVPYNSAWDAEIQSEVTDALNTYDPPTNTELEARTLVAASYATAAALATVDTAASAIQGVTDLFSFTGSDVKATLDGETVTPADGSITAAKIATDAITAAKLAADAVTEIQSGLSTLNAAGVRTAVGLASANLDTQLGDLPTNAELATALAGADDAILTRLGTPAGASIAADIAAVEAQTDDIGTAGAGLTAVPYNSAWDASINAQVAAALGTYDPPTNAEMVARTILAADYFTPADYTAPDNAGIAALELDTAAIEGKIDTLDLVADAIKVVTDQFGFTSGAVDANVERINGDATAAALLALSAGTMVSGAAQAGTLSNTQMTTNLSSSTNDYYTGRTVIFTSGALQYQAAAVEAYNGATKVITFSARTGAPQAGDAFILV